MVISLESYSFNVLQKTRDEQDIKGIKDGPFLGIDNLNVIDNSSSLNKENDVHEGVWI